MADANDKTQAAQAKDAPADAATGAQESSNAEARDNQKAARAARGNNGADKPGSYRNKALSNEENREDEARMENDGAPALMSREEAAEYTRRNAEAEGKDAPYSPERDVTSATHNDPDKTPPEGSHPREDLEKLKGPVQAGQEQAEEFRNRDQATSAETPAGDPRPHPQASATANMVDAPGRAHTLSYDEDQERAVALGERLKAAQETEQLEIRPKTHPGISTDDPHARYDVALELRAQWPGIVLGDDEDAVPGPAVASNADEG